MGVKSLMPVLEQQANKLLVRTTIRCLTFIVIFLSKHIPHIRLSKKELKLVFRKNKKSKKVMLFQIYRRMSIYLTKL